MIPRTLATHLRKMTTVFPIVSLTGPRQSGKTTLVKALFPEYVYTNLENLDDRAAAVEDPRGFLNAYRRKGTIIDEAQKVPELFSYLQGIVDESGEMGKYILTGSQNFLLLENITQSLAGRVAVTHLLPFGLDELRETVFTDETTLDQVLFSGLYPPLYDRKMEPPDFYPSYLQTYIERDVRAIKNIGNLNTFTRFLQLCAGRVGQLLNLSAIGNEVGIDAKTVRSWLSVLEASFVIFFLSPFYKNYNKRVVKQPKLYFYDTGLICALLGLQSAAQLSTFYLRGNLFENFVIAEYLKERIHRGKQPNAYFWRDNTGNEVNLLLNNGTTLLAAEIKSGQTITPDFFRNLARFRRYSGLPSECSYLVYGGDTAMKRKAAQVLSWRNMQRLHGV